MPLNRTVYLADEVIALCEYLPAEDDWNDYQCWQDEDTRRGYNFIRRESFEEYANGPVRSRFLAAIVRLADQVPVGSIFLSPEGSPPDLAIMLYRPYRGLGYGTRAFALGARYCFETLRLDSITAGCYPTNPASMAMLKKCGFQRHPEGDQPETSKFTGEPIIQLDFIKYPNNSPHMEG